MLDVLLDAHLLGAAPEDRFRFHDLIRLHAREQAESQEHARSVQDKITSDVITYYLGMTALADRVIMGERTRIADHRLLIRGLESSFSLKPDPAAALHWLSIERANILAILHAAFEREWYEQVWQLAEAMVPLFLNHRYLDDWLETTDLGVAAAQRVSNVAAEARLRSVVSRAYTDLGRPDRAWEHLDRALPLALCSGNKVLVASVWEFIGRARESSNDLDGAVAAYREAEAHNLAAGERRGQALAQLFMGRALDSAGHHVQAIELLRNARDVLIELDDQRMANRSSISLAIAHQYLGQLSEAKEELEQAVHFFSQTQAWHYEAEARETLAEILQQIGDHEGARVHLERAEQLRRAK